MRPDGCVFVATSLDGFVARSDGSLDFLASPDVAADPEDYGFAEFVSGVDAMVMGRVTYETVLGFAEWPYPGLRVIVPSRTLVPRTGSGPGEVQITGESPGDLFDRLGAEGVRRVYVDGGKLVAAYLEAGLIREITVTRVPVLLGDGISLFARSDSERRLTHLDTRSWANGFVRSRYRVGPVVLRDRPGGADDDADGPAADGPVADEPAAEDA